MKYNYKYDDQNRMTESEALKWNSTKNTWGKDMCIRYAYQGKTLSLIHISDLFLREIMTDKSACRAMHTTN